MVVFILYCKADLEGVNSLQLSKTNGANLCFSVRNPKDANEVREKIVVDPAILQDAAVPDHERHRAETPNHFGLKWDLETHRSTLRILGVSSLLVDGGGDDDDNNKDPNKKSHKRKAKHHTNVELEQALAQVRDMKGDESGSFVPMLALDCNGLEPYAFHPMGGEFIAVGSTGGTSHENVDLSDGNWSDYELSTGTIAVTNFCSKFQ